MIVYGGRQQLCCTQERHLCAGRSCLAKKPWIVPIPGTTKLSRVEENIAATRLDLTASDMNELDELTSTFVVTGDRYPAEVKQMTNR